MAEPTTKADQIESFLENISGRTTSIKANRCIAVPIGCGKEISRFRNAVSEREYRISGLCQECQDKVFGRD